MRQLLKSLLARVLPKSLLLTHGRAATAHTAVCKRPWACPRGSTAFALLSTIDPVAQKPLNPRHKAGGVASAQSASCGRATSEVGIELALTFDDGPHPEQTPRLLDVLAEAGVRGTFFVVGERAEQQPDLVRRIADEGHELGNHTWTHSEPSQTSASQFLNEIARTRRLIQDLTGRDCRVTRPPKGSLTIGKALGLWRQQQTIALWNIDPKDFSMSDNSAISLWLADYRPQSGDIVLLHDNHPRAAIAVEQLAANTALRFVTLSDWLHPTQQVMASPTRPRELEVADAR